MVYDLLILGGGPGGYTAAERAGNAGLKIALFEKDTLGGVCLNEGCIPTKTMLNSAKIYNHANNSEIFAVTSADVSFNQAQVVKRKNKVVKILVGGVKAKMKNSGVEVIKADASLHGKEGALFRVDACNETYLGKNLLIATGSTPTIPPISGLKEGLESGFVVTNKEILDLEEIPERLTVIGGGVIGLEMASYFQTIGSRVTVIEMQDHIAGDTDSQIRKMLQDIYTKKGIKFILEAKVTKVGDGYIRYESTDVSAEIEADIVLLSVGRRPVIEGYGLDSLGVEVEGGAIKTDAQCRTNIPRVYAAGDVNGRWMLAHAASREAEVAVNTILGKEDEMTYNNCPGVIYTSPEVAYVGATTAELDLEGRPYKMIDIPFSYSGRYMAETNREQSLCKLIVDEVDHTLVGCHLLGPYVSEIIITAGIMIERKMTLTEIKQQIFPHPTVAEIIREGIFLLQG
ncbi:MAG TPA: dihydrolipoyl dehydrogenase [Clostridiaceae bacterium]|nr:dihydrolipoyl dehydrogenase [Clostridiaceae bacterium]